LSNDIGIIGSSLLQGFLFNTAMSNDLLIEIFFWQSSNFKMVRSKKQDKLEQPTLENEKETAQNLRKTRGASKAPPAKDRNQGNKGNDMARGSSKAPAAEDRSEGSKEDAMLEGSRRRKKQESTEKVSLNVKSKAKILPPAVLGVVFGEVEMPVPNLQETQRKREQDALKCGRVVKTVGDTVDRVPSSKTMGTVSENIVLKKSMKDVLPLASPEGDSSYCCITLNHT